MAEPRDHMSAAAGRGHLRASHADREQAIDVLKAAFVHGLLDKDEFDLRVGQALASRTYADLAAVAGDIPARLSAAQPPRAPAPAQPWLTMHKAITWGACMVIAATIGVVAATFTNNMGIFYLSAFAFIGATVVAGTMIVEAWDQQRSRRQLPQGPAAGSGDQASRPTAPGAEAEPLPQIDQGKQHPAEASPVRLRRPQLSGSRPRHRRRPRGHDYAIGCAGH
jgi:Domain of unknown function (DUF1707)